MAESPGKFWDVADFRASLLAMLIKVRCHKQPQREASLEKDHPRYPGQEHCFTSSPTLFYIYCFFEWVRECAISNESDTSTTR
jgi:hypothetical protein